MHKYEIWFSRFCACLFAMILAACNLPSNRPALPTLPFPTFLPSLSPVPTLLLPTPPAQPFLTPTLMLSSTNTTLPIHTQLPTPCNRAEFVGDVTIPDGMQIVTGASYTKIWRLRNIGSCTWTSGYVLLFDHGDPMDAPSTQPLTSGSVPPGAVVEVSVTLRAPSAPGTYQSHFRLRSPDNIVFGIGPSGQGTFWAKIVAPQPTATITNTPTPPDFESLIGYGGGGGGLGYIGYCAEYESTHTVSRPSVFGTSATVGPYYSERIGEICLRGIKPGLPFSVRIVSPDGQITLRGNFSADKNTFYWEGYTDAETSPWYVTLNQDGLIDVDLLIWWPPGLPFGNWQVYSEGKGLQVQGYFDAPRERSDLRINRVQEISIAEPNSFTKMVPIDSYGRHRVKANSNGGLEVTGSTSSPNSLIYVLIYKATYQTDSNQTLQWNLIYRVGATAGVNGQLFVTLPDLFSDDEEFLVVSVSDPTRLVEHNTKLLNLSSDSIGYEHFYIQPDVSRGGDNLVVAVTDPTARIGEENGSFDTGLPHDFFQLVGP